MHHYVASTCYTISDNPADLVQWQVHIPRLAFPHPFLLHGSLALSALHRCTTEVSEQSQAELTLLARAYQTEALPAYISQLQDITEVNCHAVFAYLIVLEALSYAFLQQSGSPGEEESGEAAIPKDIVEETISAFDTLIGATIIAGHACTWLRQGILVSLIRPVTLPEVFMARIRLDIKAILEKLMSELPTDDSSQEHLATTYATAIQALGVSFPHENEATLPTITEVVSWPYTAGASYSRLLKEGDELALLILAYYAFALCYHSGKIWYLQGLGKRLVIAIAERMGAATRWRAQITWAKEQVGEQ
ncbi:MAG: hypothetical protein Q9220_007560 [cf. Caloplaca sp. 1 TL-2023]